MIHPFHAASLLAILAAVPLSAQSSLPAKFSLDLNGKPIGKADFIVKPVKTGWDMTAHYQFNLQANIATTREARYQKDWELLSESNSVEAGPTKQSLTLTANGPRTSLAFRATVGGQEYPKDFPLQSHTVVLANFDPSGVQVLLNMHRTNPATDGKYQCFIPSGTGTMLACSLSPAADGTGTLADKPVSLKHWTLSLASLEMDIWADLDGDLMRAAVASQSLAYVRQGFELNKAPVVVTIPPPEVLERDVTFPSDGLTVPGTLTLPEHSSHVPIAVLVQGSGVQDRDETVGQNKVFQQLAWGLAQRGIATLRYDRRPKFAPANFAQHADLDHEVVIDAASALAYCSSLPEINPKNVFLIGHSLGAQLAPYVVKRRLAQQPNSVRGYVLLAGVQTPIDQTLLRQIAEFGKAGGESDAEIQQQLAKWKAIFADIADPRTPADKLEGMGTTAGYWRDWLARDPAAVMKTLPVPALVLRGELDRNVLHEDFTALAAAATAQGSKSEEFPRLNHLFMPTADELLPGTIAPSVMDTISVWIKSLN